LDPEIGGAWVTLIVYGGRTCERESKEAERGVEVGERRRDF